MCNSDECKLAREKYSLVPLVNSVYFLALRIGNEIETPLSFMRKMSTLDDDAVKRCYFANKFPNSFHQAIHSYVYDDDESDEEEN